MMIMMMTMMISDVGKGLDVRPSSSTSRGQRGRSLRCLRTWKTWASRWPQSVTWSRLTLTGWPFHLQACSQFQDWNWVLIDLFQGLEAKLSSLRRQRLGGWLTESIPPSSTGSSFILIPHFIQFLIFAAISIVSGEHSRLWLWSVQHAPAGLCQWGRHRQGLAGAGRRAPRAGLLTFMSTTSTPIIMSEAKNCENVRSFFTALLASWQLVDQVNEPTSTFAAHGDKVSIVKFHPTAEVRKAGEMVDKVDQDILATAAYDFTIKIWNLGDPKAETHSLDGHEDQVRWFSQGMWLPPLGFLLCLEPMWSTYRVCLQGWQG